MNPFFIIILLFGTCLTSHAQKTLELSGKNAPMFLTVSITDASGQVLQTKEINGRGFEWVSIPATATHFFLKSLGTPTPSQSFYQESNTFASVESLAPKNFDLATQPGLNVTLKQTQQLASGKTGYIFIGTLERNQSDPAWKSMFLAAENGNRLDGPGIPTLELSTLKSIVASTPIFTVDFPLNLRSSVGGSVDGILRPGQKVKVISLDPPNSNQSVFAKVEVQ
jgi:hypothetical protein